MADAQQKTGADPGRPGPADAAPDPRPGRRWRARKGWRRARSPGRIRCPASTLSFHLKELSRTGVLEARPRRAVHPSMHCRRPALKELAGYIAGLAGSTRRGAGSQGDGRQVPAAQPCRRSPASSRSSGTEDGDPGGSVAHEVRDEVVHRRRVQPRRVREQRLDAAALLFREDRRQRAAKLLDQHGVALCAPAAMADRGIDVDALGRACRP